MISYIPARHYTQSLHRDPFKPPPDQIPFIPRAIVTHPIPPREKPSPTTDFTTTPTVIDFVFSYITRSDAEAS